MSSIEVAQLNPEALLLRSNGVVYTPFEVAEALTRHALENCGKDTPLTLEPSAGDGAFLRSLRNLGVPEDVVTAIDIDEDATATLHTEFSDCTIITCDFLDYWAKNSDDSYDLIIGNPPYIRRQNFQESWIDEIRELSLKTSYPLTQLKNAWAAFTLAASRMLSRDGVLAFVVPYELMTVNYGQYLQSTVFTAFHRVDIFIPDEETFSGIEQNTVAFVASKGQDGTEGVHINRVRSLANLETISSTNVRHSTTKNLAIDLKAFLMDSETIELLHKVRSELHTVSVYCESSTGIVTAANEFFILNEENVQKYELKPWARRILKKGSFLPHGPVFDDCHFDSLSETEPCYLIDFRQSGAEPLTESALRYLRNGERLKLNSRYKCRHREPWYKIPIVTESEGLFFKRSHNYPRICINAAKILVTDTAYQIRMHDGYSIRALCYSFYNSLTMLFAEIDGRFYAGGVLELTPREFKGLPLAYHEPSEHEFSTFIDNFPRASEQENQFIGFGDCWLKSKMQLSDQDMKRIQNALRTIRNHRLRRGAESIFHPK